MPAELTIAGAVVVAAAVTSIAIPRVIALARRLDFLDRPEGYKKHGVPTPYLGGLAVVLGFVVSALLFGGGAGRYWPIVVGAIALSAVGTLDDRVRLGPLSRVLVTLVAAAGLSAAGLGWHFLGSGVGDAALTLVWVVAIVNGFNLMDNLDGACATVAAASATGIAVICALTGNFDLAAMAAAIAAACVAFLRANLSRPPRLFLGDGGSMPIGFVIAALVMAGPGRVGVEWKPFLMGGMLVSLVIFDTSLVVFSRLRRGVPVLSGGRDHLTHRLLSRLGTERRVAVALLLVQTSACALAVVAAETADWHLALGFAVGCMSVGAAALFVLEAVYGRTAVPPPGGGDVQAEPGRAPAR
jgi:UDP-GlcNAc:undecaprenyl-phosphate GlcNAc-1-phosphate transferase